MNLTQQMAYLKHVGELQNVKVTVLCDGGRTEIHIHDHTFYTFQDALNYLKRDAQTLAHDDKNNLEVI